MPSVLDAGYQFQTSLILTEAEIVAGAQFVGDLNPIHSDPAHPHTQKIGSIIASGSHISGLFSAMIPTEYSKFGHIIGVEMSLKFLQPVYPATKYVMCWQVNDSTYNEGIGGHFAHLSGSIHKAHESKKDQVVRAKADIIYYGDMRQK